MSRKTSGRGWVLQMINPGASIDSHKDDVIPQLELSDLNDQQRLPPAKGRAKLMERLFSGGPTPCVSSGGTSRGRLLMTISDLSTKSTSQLEQPKEVGVPPVPLNKTELISKKKEDLKNCGTLDELTNAVGNLSIANKTMHSALPVVDDDKPLNLIHKIRTTTGAIIKLKNVINLQNWMVVHCESVFTISEFIKQLEQQLPLFGVNIAQPTIVHIQSHQNEDYTNVLKDSLGQDVQFVTCILNSRNYDIFKAIKKICYEEMEIPSQFILSATLPHLSKRHIMHNFAMQMKCKLNGSIWNIKLPPMSAMFCGIDSYKNNVITANINTNCTHFYCREILQEKKNEIVTELCSSMIFALTGYQENNNYLPEKIVIFRTGVDDGQPSFDAAYEISQFQRVCSTSFRNYNPKITFIVIPRKSLNSNPMANTFTQGYRYDFSLNWQKAPKSQVNATRFVVVHDDSDHSPAFLQKLVKELSTPCVDMPFKERIPVCSEYAENMAKFIAKCLQMDCDI